MNLDEIYQEVILDHFRHPRCHGCLSPAPYAAQLFNPLCGDQLSLTLDSNGELITDIAFSGHGCSISQASASMMTDLVKGRSITEARALCASFKAMMRGDVEGEDLPELGDASALQGVRKFSARVKCAVLAWEALEKCLEQVGSSKVS